uniref:Secreted protein n=1 Tax=Salarias fasciatus TaxID=181472 RepID=A0A672HCZ8_SALFA
MMCSLLTTLVTFPGAPLSIQVTANVGYCGGISARMLDCPSICFTHQRDVLNPLVESEQRGEKGMLSLQKKANCVNDKLQRGKRTLH